MFKEFRDFAMRGNVVDMAVGIIVGAAFGSIDIIMPPLGLLLGNVDFTDLFVVLKQGGSPGPYLTLAAAQQAGAVTLSYGMFVNRVLSFLIVAFAVFALVKGMNTMRRKQETEPEASPAPAEDVVLLREIRDALRNR